MAVGDDLLGLPRSADHADRHGRDAGLAADFGGVGHLVAWAEREFLAAGRDAAGRGDDVVAAEFLQRAGEDDAVGDVPAALHPVDGALKELGRSEEHTSELQSLMRISYAVFCLK